MIKIFCKLRALREKKDLTQECLAEKLGISRQSIISVESGKSTPSLSLALGIANLFESTIEEIFECEEEINRAIPDDTSGRPALDAFGVGHREVKMSRDLLPLRPMGMGRFFEEDWPEVEFPKTLSIITPAVNIYESGKNVIVECQLPGIDPENVKIDVASDLVKISGEQKQEIEEKNKNYYRKEISYGTFARSVALPKKVRSAKAEADYSDGILKITLPKIEEKESKTIKIKVKKK